MAELSCDREFSRRDRDDVTHKPKVLTIWPFTEKVSQPLFKLFRRDRQVSKS